MASWRSVRRRAHLQAGYRSGRRTLLSRLGGFGAVLAALLFVAWGYLDQENAPPYYDVVVDNLAVTVPALFMLGLAALWARYVRRLSRLTQMGIAIALVGAALGTIRNLEGVAGPLWQAYAPKTSYPALLLYVWVPIAWIPALFAGLLLGGVGSLGERSTRGLGAVLLAMGACGWIYYLTDSGNLFEARAVHVAFGLLFSMGWFVLGRMLWKGE